MMNLKSLIIGLLLLSTGVAHGQSNVFDVGVEGGLNSSFLHVNDTSEKYQKRTIGFAGGLFFQLNSKGVFSLRTGFSYERKTFLLDGTFLSSLGATNRITVRDDFDYWIVSTLLRATFGKKVKCFANVGPYFGFLQRRTYTNSNNGRIVNYTFDSSENHKWNNMGILMGIGLSVPIKTRIVISIEARHGYGFPRLYESHLFFQSPVKMHATSLLLGVTYKFKYRTPKPTSSTSRNSS